MKPFISLFLFVFLLQFSTYRHAQSINTFDDVDTTHSDIIISTCENCSLVDPNMNYHNCVDSLSSAPESHNTDLKGLGLIAVEIAINKTTKIEFKVGNMLYERRRLMEIMGFTGCDRMYTGLENCLELYSNSLSRLSESSREIKDGNYGDASGYLSEAIMNTPGGCEAGFLELEVDSPLTKDNVDFTTHVTLALAVTDLLHSQEN